MTLPLGLKLDPQTEEVRDILRKLDHYDFGHIIDDCVAKLGWEKNYSKVVARQFKQFLSLMIIDPDQFHSPGRDVDEMWHRAILNTQWYSDMCDTVFGMYVHHNPILAVGEQHEGYRARTPQVLAHWFGAQAYPTDFELVQTCQQCNIPTVVPFARPAAEAMFGAAA